MKKLYDNCDAVMKSEPIKIFTRNERINVNVLIVQYFFFLILSEYPLDKQQWWSLYEAGVIEGIYKDKNDMIEQTKMAPSIPSAISLPEKFPITKKREILMTWVTAGAPKKKI